MAPIEFYPVLKPLHVGLAALSVGLFGLRALAALAGARWPKAAAARRASVVLDTLLLAAGATLWALLSLNPLREHWLGVKLLLVVAYIVLGALALGRARTRLGRVLALGLALGCIGAVVLIARAHDAAAPLRWFVPAG